MIAFYQAQIFCLESPNKKRTVLEEDAGASIKVAGEIGSRCR